MKNVAACTALALLLAGCGENDPAPTEEASRPPEAVAYRTVDDLRAAVEDAGIECADFERVNDPAYAAEQAHCTYTVVLQIFATEIDKQRNLDALNDSRLVGPNWLVGGEMGELEQLAKKLGGVVRERAPEAESERRERLDEQLDELERELENEG